MIVVACVATGFFQPTSAVRTYVRTSTYFRETKGLKMLPSASYGMHDDVARTTFIVVRYLQSKVHLDLEKNLNHAKHFPTNLGSRPEVRTNENYKAPPIRR